MTDQNRKKYIWLLVLFIVLTIFVFCAEILFSKEIAFTQREEIIFQFFLFFSSLFIGWFLQKIMSFDEYQSQLKKYAYSAHRRITDIENNLIMLLNAIDKINITQISINDISLIKVILNFLQRDLSSSRDDWKEVIGKELQIKLQIQNLTKEEMILLDRMKTEESVNEISERIDKTREDIEIAKKKIPQFVQDAPSDLFNYQDSYRIIEQYYSYHLEYSSFLNIGINIEESRLKDFEAYLGTRKPIFICETDSNIPPNLLRVNDENQILLGFVRVPPKIDFVNAEAFVNYLFTLIQRSFVPEEKIQMFKLKGNIVEINNYELTFSDNSKSSAIIAIDRYRGNAPEIP